MPSRRTSRRACTPAGSGASTARARRSRRKSSSARTACPCTWRRPSAALATWTTSASGGHPVRLRPIDAFGAPRGPTRDVAAAGALYGLLIRSTPSGGALLAWHESHFDAEPRWRLRVQSVDADGVPLAPPSAVMTGTTMAEAWELLVHPSGDRALLIYSHGGDAVDAQALRCAG